MGQHGSITKGKNTRLDFKALAETVDDMREMTRALVAGLVADGFTEREARTVVTSMLAMAANSAQEKGDET